MQKVGVCEQCPLRGCDYVRPAGAAVGADVVVIGGFPIKVDVEKGAFASSSGATLRKIVQDIATRDFDNQTRPRVAYTYALRCSPPYNKDKKRFETSIEAINQCSVVTMKWLDRMKPKAILAFGTDAVKALGFKETIRAMRGGVYDIKLSDGTRVPVIPTYHIVEVSEKNPGFLPTLKCDITKALRLAAGDDFVGRLNARVFKEPDVIVEKLGKIKEFAQLNFEKKGTKLGLSVDTETTSLTPSNFNDRVIAVSLAFRDNEGVAFPFEHGAIPFTDEEFGRVKGALEDLLSSPHVSLIMCNGKFDVQWLKYRYGIKMQDCAWDCQLAEHNLDEDKKGEYSLKDITRDRFPALGRYEQELKNHLTAKQSEFNDEWKAQVEAHTERTKQAMLDWWMALTDDERRVILNDWFEKRFVNLEEVQYLKQVRYRKLKGEMTIPKKYKDAVAKMLAGVGEVETPGLVLPEAPEGPKPKEVTFEDIDVDTLLWYAAIDAQATRMIAGQQLPEFKQEWQRILQTRAKERKISPMQTVPLIQAFKNITMPLSAAIAHMEFHGVRLDRDRCEEYVGVVREKMEEAKDTLYSQVGYKFSLSSSSPDLGKILFEDMKLPIKKRTDSGAPSTDADTLRELSDEFDLQFIGDLLKYRKLDKCLNTYLLNWMKMSARDGRIHCGFNQIGTATHRLSSSNPERCKLGLL